MNFSLLIRKISYIDCLNSGNSRKNRIGILLCCAAYSQSEQLLKLVSVFAIVP